MFKLIIDFKLTKFIIHLLLFSCIIFSPAVLEAQRATENSYEQEFFEKLYPLVSDFSADNSKKLENLITELKSLPISNEANTKIIRRLLIEAHQTAESNLPKANIFWSAAELIAAQDSDRLALANAIWISRAFGASGKTWHTLRQFSISA